MKRQQTLVVGIDCSTTATKATVWDRSGTLHAESRSPIKLYTPAPFQFEHDARQWWQSCREALAEIAAEVDTGRIAGLSITHQRESFVMLDANDEPLRPAILWLDERARKDVALLRDALGSDEIRRITGKDPDPTPALYALHWLRRHEPGIYARAARVVDVHGYLNRRLTGRHATSWASADPLGLLDMASRQWSQPLLDILDLSTNQLPELVAPGAPIGELGHAAATATGLPAGLPVIAGGGDGQYAGLGVNVLDRRRAYLSLGTGAVSGIMADDYTPSMAYRTMTAPVPDGYILETCLRTCGHLVNWLRDTIGVGDPAGCTAEALEKAAADTPIGADGLLLLPYWGGVMSPYWDESARGALVGLSGDHGHGQMYRALLEGLAMEQWVATGATLRASGRDIDEIAVLGGVASSDLLCRILADVMNKPVVRAATAEPPCLGAAIAAAVGCGWFDDFETAANTMTRDDERIEPNPGHAARYDELKPIYADLYPALSGITRRLAAFRRASRDAD
ncbi:FGGY-family carbohydrate kinase [Salinisphaera sp.]|uniref:xylulokinase n=1 Tax=Salinisphaera sp. TaxID=1914330 RepID=UPI002D76B70F|nr:FGGY-family carbohydrate kinase [Salinisphaera sp.]HET7315495.1 FGGY-family carbohydrate kinase [Salinisphaera sp.]